MTFPNMVLNARKSTKRGVQTMYTEDDVMSDLWSKKLSGMSLRKIAAEYPGLTFADIQRGLKGIFPKSVNKRFAFGLQTEHITTLTIMMDEPIPAGTQVITATRCECGRWYISNHPARKRCFICRPYGGKR